MHSQLHSWSKFWLFGLAIIWLSIFSSIPV